MYPTSLAHELSQILEGTQKAEQSEFGSDMKRYTDAERKVMLITSHRDDTQPTNLNSAEYRGGEHLRMMRDFGGPVVMGARQAVDND